MRPVFPPFLSLSLLLLPAAALPAQERLRFDIAGFDVPAGWTKATESGQLVLRDAAQTATVTVGRSAVLEGTIEEHGQRLVAAAAKLPGHRLEAPSNHGWHAKSRGQWHNFVHSHEQQGQPGKFHYVAVLTVAGGGRCISFTLTTQTVADYEAARSVVGELVQGVVLSTTQRLERGAPPLTRFMVDETTDFLEWLVHAPLTEEQRGVVESELRRFWKEKLQDDIDGTTEMLAARGELAKLGEAERELARQTILEQALAAWRKDDQSAGARMMLAIHAAANEPIAAGEPPLTRQAVDAFAEFFVFAAGQVAGCEGRLGKEVRDELAKTTAEGYADMPAEQRETIAGMPLLWAALRVAWPELPAEQKQAYVDAWRQSKPIADLGAALRQQQEKAREIEGASNSMRDLLRRQAQLNAQQLHFTMMQNVMRGQMETMRIMSSNLGGNTQWAYRW